MNEIKKPFWMWVFAEADGTPSFTRVATAVCVAFAMGWVTHIVWRSHTLPDFAGLAMLIGTLYALNVAKNALNKPPQQ